MRVGGSVSQRKRADFEISQEGVLSVTLFLVAMNGVLGELGNRMHGPLFTYNLAIYASTRNRRVAARALQGVTNKLDAWAVERN